MALCKFSCVKTCQKKVPYNTAKRAKRKMRQLRGIGINVVKYKCPECGHWHLGGRNPKKEEEVVKISFLELMEQVANEIIVDKTFPFLTH